MNQKRIPIRLSNDTNYSRPKKTIQDILTKEEIKEKLMNYKKVEDITKIVIGSHIRYFTKDIKTKKNMFRLGGFLTKFGEDYKWLILSNGEFSWSVQINRNNEFWVKINPKDMQEQIQTELEEVIGDKYKKKYEDMKNQTDYVIKMLKDQQKENNKLKQKLDAIEEVAKKDKNRKN
jgi:uncharacterized protein YbcI